MTTTGFDRVTLLAGWIEPDGRAEAFGFALHPPDGALRIALGHQGLCQNGQAGKDGVSSTNRIEWDTSAS